MAKASSKNTSESKGKKGKTQNSKTPAKAIQMPTTQKHVVTEEDLSNNADLVTEGVVVGDDIEIPVPPVMEKQTPLAADKPKRSEKSDEEKLAEIMKPYLKSNPACKKFLLASDGMVFYGEFYQAAKDHQKNVDATKELQVYEVK